MLRIVYMLYSGWDIKIIRSNCETEGLEPYCIYYKTEEEEIKSAVNKYHYFDVAINT